MELRGIVIMLLIVGGVVVGLSSFYVNMFNSYGKPVEDVSFIGKANQTLSMTNEMSLKTQGSDLTDIVAFIFKAPYRVIKLAFGSVVIAKSMLTDMFNLMGLPNWFFNLIIGIFLVIITFAVLSAYLKWKV